MKKFFVLLVSALLSFACTGGKYSLYVGTYGSGIHILEYDDGIVGEQAFVPAENASFLTLGEASDMYAVSERGDESGVYSFGLGESGWTMKSFCSQVGADPCYILPISRTGLVATADYSGGTLSVFNIEDAAILGRCQVYGESGHIHQVREIPAAFGCDGRFFLISDLGNDCIYVAQLEGERLVIVSRVVCPDGSGPRHMEFNLRNGLLYCLTELSGELLVWKVSGASGVPCFSHMQTLQADPVNAGASADIHIHPNGKWLYTSHRRSADGIHTWAVGEDGLLTSAGYTATGAHPRNFCISPDGRCLLVACRDSKSIQVYDISSGVPSAMLQEYVFESDKPVCLVFGDASASRF